jgi:exonuclease III
VKKNPSVFCIQEIYLNIKGRHYLRVKGWKKIFQANGSNKQVGIAILKSNKIGFQPKLIKRDMEQHFIHIKGKIHQDDISVLNIYAPNAWETSLKLKSHIKLHILIVGDYNTIF